MAIIGPTLRKYAQKKTEPITFDWEKDIEPYPEPEYRKPTFAKPTSFVAGGYTPTIREAKPSGSDYLSGEWERFKGSGSGSRKWKSWEWDEPKGLGMIFGRPMAGRAKSEGVGGTSMRNQAYRDWYAKTFGAGTTAEEQRIAEIPTGYATTTEWTPPGDEPTMADIPEFEAPEYDEAEISRLTQKRAAPGVRRLRGAVQMAMGGVYESPQIRRMTLRQALAGYGMGLESVMGGAGREAAGEYERRYGKEFAAERMEWQANVQRLSQIYAGAMSAWARKGEQVTTRETQYGMEDILKAKA